MWGVSLQESKSKIYIRIIKHKFIKQREETIRRKPDWIKRSDIHINNCIYVFSALMLFRSEETKSSKVLGKNMCVCARESESTYERSICLTAVCVCVCVCVRVCVWGWRHMKSDFGDLIENKQTEEMVNLLSPRPWILFFGCVDSQLNLVGIRMSDITVYLHYYRVFANICMCCLLAIMCVRSSRMFCCDTVCLYVAVCLRVWVRLCHALWEIWKSVCCRRKRGISTFLNHVTYSKWKIHFCAGQVHYKLICAARDYSIQPGSRNHLFEFFTDLY